MMIFDEFQDSGLWNAPCPLHEDFLKLQETGRKFLEQTSLAVFAAKKSATE